ncbi:MAG: hypothetical protein OXB98_08630 [Bryobacterales bacterium]|nr:hypothetical protein [Bryobacterales bacterium]
MANNSEQGSNDRAAVFVLRLFSPPWRTRSEKNGDKVRDSCLVIREKPKGRVAVVGGSLYS